MSHKVIDLLHAAFDKPNLQQQLHSADTAEQFVKIARENGYELSKEELASALGKVHIVFGQVVQSMMGELMAQGSPDHAETESISGTNTDLVKRLFSRGEAFDSAGFITFFTDTPVYQFGNFDVCLDKESIKKSADAFFSQIDAVYHEIKMIWEEGDAVFVEMDVTYWRKDGSVVSLPCFDIFRVEGDKFSELRIFMDVNPVFDPSIPVPESASVLTVSKGQQMLPPGTMRRHFAEHPEGKQRVAQGFIPKWSIAGPKWSIEGNTEMPSAQLAVVGELSAAIMAEDWEKVKTYLTDDLFYKVGSGAPMYGPNAVVDFFKHTFKTTAKFYGHDARKIWIEPDIITIEMDAKYEMVGSKKHVTVACCDIYRMRGNKVSEWRVYADMSPWNEAGDKTVTLEPNKDVTTVMVVFSVDPSQQQHLLDNIMTYGGSQVKYQPGFISSTLHRSLDGMRVINYTQWKTREDYENFARNSLGKAPEIFKTVPPDIHIYEIVEQTV
ncbi:nuclear transport factor 2 family protein [Anabaena sphaerica FACHB-251]|uniref:Nuclear transport factor 2 family protein n=1 Tax=Anabaena sphaerica FACHB-251 TaxID=2692883 RepID=A0A927A176_9NOST|nr:nuclear transport factor 2 family protein [Anabaena sphaerica]MBD2293150.1 nuclear transport factor 2 family protein [Anabaena sphaerica FACHB-251]